MHNDNRVNAGLNASISVEITFLISPYEIFKNDSNGHGFHFLKCYYSNIWIVHVQSLTNLPKFMWKLVYNVIDVIFQFGSPKRKAHKVFKNNAPSKTFKSICFWNKEIEKITKIATHIDLWKYGQILTIQKSLIIKYLRFSNKIFLIWIYHLVLHHILSNKNLECESI